jgi:hypothetical protein
LNSANKLEWNKTAELIILEKLEVKDTKPVSIIKISPAITKRAETVPDFSIKKLDDEFTKYKSNVDAKIDAFLSELGTVNSSVCTVM